MSETISLIVSAIVRHDDRLLLVEQRAPGYPERFVRGAGPAGAVYVRDRT